MKKQTVFFSQMVSYHNHDSFVAMGAHLAEGAKAAEKVKLK